MQNVVYIDLCMNHLNLNFLSLGDKKNYIDYRLLIYSDRLIFVIHDKLFRFKFFVTR